jgi:predicted permease
MRRIGQDLHFALRALRKNPSFTAIAVLTLACGIGANTAIFSVIRGYLMRPLPVVNHAEQLLVLAYKDSHIEFPHGLSYFDYLDYRGLSNVFQDVIARTEWPVSVNYSHGSQNERFWLEMVTTNYFRMLGVETARGRAFSTGDERAPVIILTWDCWQRRFGRDPAVIGSSLRLNGRLFTVIGVGPKVFHGTQAEMAVEGFAPLLLLDQIRPGAPAILGDRDAHVLRPIARLRSGKSLAEARAAVQVLRSQLAVQYPKTNRDVDVIVVPETQARPEVEVSSTAPRAAMFAMACVAFVLLICCANIANLLLVRANQRLREVAIRAAIGASRWQIVRLLLTESIVLSLAGGAVGAFLAPWITDLMRATNPAVDLPIQIDLSPDRMVFLFAFVLSLSTGVLCGLAPALRASRPDLSQSLKQAAALFGGGRFEQRRLTDLLVVSEVAISLMLLLVATTFVGVGRELRKVDLGLDTHHLQLLSVDISGQIYDAARARQFQQRLIERVSVLPGVHTAAFARSVPFGENGSSFRVFTEEQVPQVDTPLTIMGNLVGPGYFRTLGIQPIAGREFDDGDDKVAPLRAVVNDTLARRLWRGLASARDALGRKVRLDSGEQLEVVGVVKTGKYVFPNEQPRSYLYVPLAQHYSSILALHVRTTENPPNLVAALRDNIRALDPNLLVFDVRTLDERLDHGYLFSALNLGGRFSAFSGLLGVLLAAIGVYGVISHAVGQRTREIGIRIALGASRQDVLILAVRHGMILVATGIAIGLTGAWAGIRLLTNLLLKTSPKESLTFVWVTLTLAAVALLACYLPSRRAASVDPMNALRCD